MIWDEIIEIDNSRIGVLFFEGKDAKERAWAVIDSMALNLEQNQVISKSVGDREIVVIMGFADNRKVEDKVI